MMFQYDNNQQSKMQAEKYLPKSSESRILQFNVANRYKGDQQIKNYGRQNDYGKIINYAQKLG